MSSLTSNLGLFEKYAFRICQGWPKWIKWVYLTFCLQHWLNNLVKIYVHLNTYGSLITPRRAMISNVLLSVELNYCWFNFAKQQQLCTCTTCRHCTTSTWKCLINSGRKQLTRVFFFFLNLDMSLRNLTPTSDKVCELEWFRRKKKLKEREFTFYHRYPLKLPVTVQDVSIDLA